VQVDEKGISFVEDERARGKGKPRRPCTEGRA
jgi:hypothetical protein